MSAPTSDRTLVLVKPDGVARGLVGEVISRLEAKGLRLVAAELRTLTADVAETHYAEHAERPFFASLVEFITSAPLMALVVEGPRAVEAFRALAGGRRGDRADHAHGRALARPVRAEEAERLPRGDVDVDAVDRGEVPEALAQVAGLHQYLGGFRVRHLGDVTCAR